MSNKQPDSIALNCEGYFERLHDMLDLYMPYQNVAMITHKVVARSISVACDRASIDGTMQAIETMLLEQLAIVIDDIGEGRFEAKKSKADKQKILEEASEQNQVVVGLVIEEWVNFTRAFKADLLAVAEQQSVHDIKCYALKSIMNADTITLVCGYEDDKDEDQLTVIDYPEP